MQHNDLATYNITLHWELDKNLKIAVCNWGCTSQMSRNVDSFWHAETVDIKEKLKKEKFWMALELFRPIVRDNRIYPKYYTKEVEVL